jgi:hypothetical protein
MNKEAEAKMKSRFRLFSVSGASKSPLESRRDGVA